MNLLRLLFGLHQHKGGWPLHKRQRCVECGMSRDYELGRERQGKWRRDGENRGQRVYVLEKARSE